MVDLVAFLTRSDLQNEKWLEQRGYLLELELAYRRENYKVQPLDNLWDFYQILALLGFNQQHPLIQALIDNDYASAWLEVNSSTRLTHKQFVELCTLSGMELEDPFKSPAAQIHAAYLEYRALPGLGLNNCSYNLLETDSVQNILDAACAAEMDVIREARERIERYRPRFVDTKLGLSFSCLLFPIALARAALTFLEYGDLYFWKTGEERLIDSCNKIASKYQLATHTYTMEATVSVRRYKHQTQLRRLEAEQLASQAIEQVSRLRPSPLEYTNPSTSAFSAFTTQASFIPSGFTQFGFTQFGAYPGDCQQYPLPGSPNSENELDYEQNSFSPFDNF